MEENPIIAEIRRTRDELARESGYDVRKMMDLIRAREAEDAARGIKFVSPAKPISPKS